MIISQNVLAACDFDLHFIYILSGWEGSAADSHVFQYAQRHDLCLGSNHYFLADAGFPLCDMLLTPYWGVQYHLQEWKRGSCNITIFMSSRWSHLFLKATKPPGAFQLMPCPTSQCCWMHIWNIQAPIWTHSGGSQVLYCRSSHVHSCSWSTAQFYLYTSMILWQMMLTMWKLISILISLAPHIQDHRNLKLLHWKSWDQT